MIRYFWGEDTYAAEQEIYAIARKSSARIRWVDEHSLRNSSLPALLDQSGGLFGRDIIVVKDPSRMAKDKQKAMVAMPLAENKGTECIFWDRETPNKKTSAVYKALQKSGQYFAPPGKAQLAQWLQAESGKHGADVRADAASVFVDRVGMDKWLLENELKKLALLHSDITLEIVEKYVHAELRIAGGMFDMLDAFVQGKNDYAIGVMNMMLREGASEVQLLSMLGYQFRTLASIRQGMEKGGSVDGIAREFHLHPYVVKKNMPFARRYTLSGLIRAMMRILAIDLAIKRGSMDARTGLHMAIAGL